MCIFTQPVISVNNTQIFARLSGTGTQFLAYQMSYESSGENAMILPVPVTQPSTPTSLKFINLQDYETFFGDLANGFPFYSPPSIGCSAPFDPASRDDLEVFEVGNYIASLVPTISDFERLDSQFRLPDDIWENIPGYQTFAFAVFQLAAGSLKPHPMAFEFQSAKDELFFPTIHIHDGEIHDSETFDHILYMQHAGFDSEVYGYENSHVEDKSTGLIRSKYAASRFCDVDKSAGIIDGNLLLHRKIIRGNLPNSDTVFTVAGNPLTPSFNFRPWLSYAPWIITLGAIGWFFNRRTRIKRMRESESVQYHNESAT